MSSAHAEFAAELVALAPDVLLASGGTTLGPLQQATRTIPIVFAQVTDPVGAAVVETLARPGGNATGFTQFEYGMSGKWLELLKGGIAARVGVRRSCAIQGVPAGHRPTGGNSSRRTVARCFELRPLAVRDANEIERAVAAFAQLPNSRPHRTDRWSGCSYPTAT